ncbi:hypothetical protein [Actinocatenispora sera]|uniref:hypothetical protein n=1 Tax=Actinocatenispora sera TaxID=390989 RepID=UPI0012EE7B17|nr:hypothetical protein [Actinocatenispora sera]
MRRRSAGAVAGRAGYGWWLGGSTVLGILDEVDRSKQNTSGGWGPNHLTSIHVAMHKLSDVDIAKDYGVRAGYC